MPTLILSNKRTVKLTPVGKYFHLGSHKVDFIESNDQLRINGDEITLKNQEYDRQVADYLEGKLTLARGVVRHHPLWYEVRYMGILSPLGTGAMPHWATNQTSYIPFGPADGARGIAIGRKGMGPGDDQSALAGLAQLRESDGPVDAGLIVTVTVGPGSGVAFYNPGEIQVRGPVYRDMGVEVIELEPGDLPKPLSEDARASYLAEHGRLRHDRAVTAVTNHGTDALTEISKSAKLRKQHATALIAMRGGLMAATGKLLDVIIEGTAQNSRPSGHNDEDYRAYLDSSINREAHDAYIAAVVAGEDGDRPENAGNAAGMEWCQAVLSAVLGKVPDARSPFAVGKQDLSKS